MEDMWLGGHAHYLARGDAVADGGQFGKRATRATVGGIQDEVASCNVALVKYVVIGGPSQSGARCQLASARGAGVVEISSSATLALHSTRGFRRGGRNR